MNIRERVEFYKKNRFVRNFATLQIGNTAGNIFQALAGIIMARILEPERFGIYGLSFGLAGLISIFMGIGAQDAVTTILSGAYARKDEITMKEALAFLAKMTIITGAIVFIGALLAPLISQFFYQDYRIGFYAGIIICASIISTTAFSFSMIALQVTGRIRAMTTLGFFNNTLKTVLALIAVVSGFGVLGIVLGHFVGAVIIFVAASFLWKSVQREFTIFPHIRGLLGSIRTVPVKKYLGFSALIAVDRNLSNLYNILPIILTGVYVSTAEVSFFKIAFSYLNLGLSFMGPIGTLLNVEFPKMKELDIQRMAKNFSRISFYGLGLTTFIAIVAAAVASFAFNIVYGEKYLPAIKYVYGLVPYAILMGLGIGLGSSLRALNKVKISIIIHITNLSMGIPLGLFLIKNYGVWGTVMITTLWYSVSIMAAFLFVRVELKKSAGTKLT